ncbi:AAA family ATPase [Amnibacterium kyonggiense]
MRADGSRRPRLILVCGLGGTGKTTVADRLAQELGTACLHKDDVKASMHDAGITTPRSFEVFVGLAERLLVNRVDLVLEATMHRPEDWWILRGWQERHDLELICVVCSADRDEREQRIRMRDRHPAHAEADRRQLAQLDAEVDYGALPGVRIDVRPEGDVAGTVGDVLARLPR